jgi:hypothetical protein
MSSFDKVDCDKFHTQDERIVKVDCPNSDTVSTRIVGSCFVKSTSNPRTGNVCTHECSEVNTKCNHNVPVPAPLNPETTQIKIGKLLMVPDLYECSLKYREYKAAMLAKAREEQCAIVPVVVESSTICPVPDLVNNVTSDESFVNENKIKDLRVSPRKLFTGKESVQRSYFSGNSRTSSSGVFHDYSLGYQTTGRWREVYPPLKVVPIVNKDRVDVFAKIKDKNIDLGNYGAGDAVNVHFLSAVQGVVSAMEQDLLWPRSDSGGARSVTSNPEPQSLLSLFGGDTHKVEIAMDDELRTTMAKLTSVADTFVKQIEVTQDATTELWRRAKQALYLFGICFAAYVWLRSFERIEKCTTLLQLLVETILGMVAGLVGGYFAGNEFRKLALRLLGVQSQSTAMSTLGGLLIAILSFATCGTKLSVSAVDKVVRDAGSFEKKTKGIGSVFKWAGGIVEWVVNVVRVHVLGYPPMDLFPDEDCRVSGWTARVLAFLDDNKKGSLEICATNAEKLHALHMEGISIVSSLRVAGTGVAPLVSKINMFCTLLKTVEQKFAQACVGHSGLRIRPVVILLSGAPGVGKSMIAVPMLNDILSQELTGSDLVDFQRNYMDFIYVRQAEHKYWDGYHMRKLAVVFDDFYQQRDVAGVPDNEIMDIIRCCSVFPNVLHMADLQSKGVNVFRSHFIVATSNQLCFDPNSIHESEALKRRFDFVVKIFPKADYCLPETLSGKLEDRRLDNGKVSDLNLDIYEMHLQKYVGANGVQFTKVLDYTGLVNEIRELYKERRDEFDATCRTMHARIKKNIDERKHAQAALTDYQIKKVGLGTVEEPVILEPFDHLSGQFRVSEKKAQEARLNGKEIYEPAVDVRKNPDVQGILPSTFPDSVEPPMSITEAIRRAQYTMSDSGPTNGLISVIKTVLTPEHLEFFESSTVEYTLSQIVATDAFGFEEIYVNNSEQVLFDALVLQAVRQDETSHGIIQ